MAQKKPPHRRETPTPCPGDAARGTPMTPGDLPEEPVQRGRDNAVRPAPAPGAPVDADELERLKDRAQRRRGPRDPIAHEDTPRR